MPTIPLIKQTFPDPLIPQLYGDVVIPDVAWDTVAGLGTPDNGADVTGDHLFLNATQPDPKLAKEGDVWYDSSNNNKPYKLVNGVWTSIQDTGAAAGPDIGQWINNLVFTASDSDTVAWGTGTIKLKSGTTYTIDAGNTGNIVAITYIFLDVTVSSTVLQTTTTATSAVGANRILVAVAKNNSDAAKKAEFQVFGGFGQSTFITTDNLAANAVTANEVTANTITANKMNISTLSAIAADLGTITAGTITGGTFQTSALATTGIKFDSTSLRGYDAANTIKFELNPSTGTLTISKVVLTGLQASSSIDGQYLASASVASAAANLAMRGWTQTSAFSVTDTDTVAWGAGTFTASDGTAYSIDAGNTGNMAARTYIYLDIAISTTAYQTTTTAATAVGNGKVMIATAINNTTEATFQVFGGLGGLNVDGTSIVTGSITANEIAASTITAGKLTITTLSSITADLGTITAGTITGGTFQTASSGARVVFDSTGIKAYDSNPTQRVQILNDGSGWFGSATAFKWTAAGAVSVQSITITGSTVDGTSTLNGSLTSNVQPRAENSYNKVLFSGRNNDGLTQTPNGGSITRGLSTTKQIGGGGGGSHAFLGGNTFGTHALSTTAFTFTNTSFSFNCYVQFATLTAGGSGFGMSDATGGSVAVTAASGIAAFTDRSACFINVAGTLYAVTADGTSNTHTDVTAGITLTNFNYYRIEYTAASNAKFYINDTLVATHTSGVAYFPTTNTISPMFDCVLADAIMLFNNNYQFLLT